MGTQKKSNGSSYNLVKYFYECFGECKVSHQKVG